MLCANTASWSRRLVLTYAIGAAIGVAACAPRAESGSARRVETVVDALQRRVEVALPVRRVAVFNAFNVELIRAIGAFDTVVGMDENSAGRDYEDYWPGFDVTHTIGRGQAEPNWEQIVALKPDLVVLPRNGTWQDAETMLAPFHIPVMVLTGWDLEEHALTVKALGRLFDRPAEAERLMAFYASYRRELETRLAGVTPVPVFLENQRPFSSPIPGSGWHDMIVMAGGRNIFQNLTLRDDPQHRGSVHDLAIDPEAILDRQPSFIVKLTGGGYSAGSGDDRARTAEALRARPGWDRLEAVRAGRVRVTASFPMNACTKIIGALYLASWIHPERMAGLDPDAVMREWIEGFQGIALPAPAAYRVASTTLLAEPATLGFAPRY